MEKKEIKTDAPVTETPIPETTTTDAAPVTETETPPAKHKYADRLAKAYPGREFKSDEEYDTGMDEHLDGLEGYKDKGQSSNKKLIALFESEPQVGEIVRDCINGSTFREALARHISPEDLTAIEGDPDYEGWNKNKTDREASISKRRQFEDDYAKNIGLSKQAVTSFVEKKGMDETQADEFFQKFDSMLEDINNGKITEEHLEAIMKAFSYDSDVVSATEQGKIAGRNENIVAKKEAAPVAGDGLPRPTRSAQEPETATPAPNYMDDMVAKTKKRDVFA